jgi:hypothetical protein
MGIRWGVVALVGYYRIGYRLAVNGLSASTGSTLSLAVLSCTMRRFFVAEEISLVHGMVFLGAKSG